MTIHESEAPANTPGDLQGCPSRTRYFIHWEGDADATLRFDDPVKALRFVGYVLEEASPPEVVEVVGLPELRCRAAQAPFWNSASPQHTTSLEHERFIRRAAGILHAALPDTQKCDRLLTLFRALLPPASMAALRRLPPEVLIARLKTELPGDAPPSLAQAVSF
ncbi:hypothetical protein [Deinococcus aestuarii]|uniref:hypothetical protein n=1 Tax=Deinococcus aestuarii TaxID=2774531 RepID=UPI001C0CE0E5|nr:hypothetical protein [Deinococcus aestuarii]